MQLEGKQTGVDGKSAERERQAEVPSAVSETRAIGRLLPRDVIRVRDAT